MGQRQPCNSGGVSRLTDSPATDQDAAVGQPAADRPRAAANAADGSRAELRERLRNLAPSHASAIPREAARSDARQPTADSPQPHGDDSPQPHGDDLPSPHGDDSPQRHEGVGWRSFDTLKRRFWDQADHFRSLWTDHQQRWPRAAAREHLRPDDPPGSWRGPGDRTLSPEQNAVANEVIAVLQECEPAVTDTLQDLALQSPFGARLVGLEHRLKEPHRVKEKLSESLRAEDIADVVEASKDVFDSVRYTYCFDVEQYAEGYADMHERLESAGYKMIFRANRWVDDAEYPASIAAGSPRTGTGSSCSATRRRASSPRNS